MKVGKRKYLVLIAIAALFFMAKVFVSSRNINVVEGKTAMEKSDNWDIMIANSVNMQGLLMNVDGASFKLEEGDIYMDEHRNILISGRILTSVFNCATNRFFNTMLVLEKTDNRLIFTAGSNTASINGIDTNIITPATMVESRMYVPLRTVCETFGYTSSFDYMQNCITIANNKAEEKIYPYKYDYRLDGKVPKIRNQGGNGSCWAFASLSALSTTMMPEKKYEFSVDNMCYHNGYSIDSDTGGEATMSMAYLTSWKGPVLESEDVTGDGKSPDGLKSVAHIQEIQIIDSKNYNEIKKYVFLYGGVQSSLYMADSTGKTSSSYNADTKSYCYVGTEKSNHDIVIVGWDDSYPADNFINKPENDGAFICLNSWGESFGDNGFFYVSYYDSNIGIHNVAYTGIESVDNYDNIYQCDELGWVGQIGFGRVSAYFANVYKAKGNEELKSVGFYATGENTEYEIYTVENFEDENSFSSKKLVSRGNFLHAGYYTVKLNETINMKENEKIAVVIFIKTPNSVHPIAVEYKSALTENANIYDGEGYISSNGKNWERVEYTQNCNLCLKLYTDDKE